MENPFKSCSDSALGHAVCAHPTGNIHQKALVMANAIWVLSWNVEHFRGKTDRLPGGVV